MSSDETTNDWLRACRLIAEAGQDRGVHQTYPDANKRLSLLAAANSLSVASSPTQHSLGQALHEQLKALVTQAQSIDRIGKCPVVGITGLLNSGKSSLLSSYLSSAGRRRVLRGTANNQGTHRFVLWLPEIWWREPDLLEIIRQYIRDLFGVLPEALADDPEQAYAQYNGQVLQSADRSDPTADPLQIPLIAGDAGLNELGLALLDCPDIQTAFGPGSVASSASTHRELNTHFIDTEQIQQHRRQMLGRVGRLCSAFLVVSKLSSLHDDTLLSILETLRDTMPGVRRILCVNKVKARYSPAVVDEQSRALVDQFQIAHVYMAYDFRSHWAEHRLPPAPPNLNATAEDPLPIFFRAAETSSNQAMNQTVNPAANKPVNQSVNPSIAAPRELPSRQSEQPVAGMHPPRVDGYLQDLSHLLNPGSLVIESRRSILNQLDNASGQTLTWFERNQAERLRRMHDAWQTIANACYAFMAQRDDHDDSVSLRLQTSPAIVAQMSDSLVKAAPWTMRPSLWVDRTMRRLQSSIASGVKQVRWFQNVSSSLSNFVGSFRKGTTGKVVTSDRFLAQLHRSDLHGALSSMPDESLKSACEHALVRFQKEDSTRLDQEWLDKWSAELWQHMSFKRMVYVGVMPLAPIFGPLLAVTLIPFDGGGSAVLVFATTKELLMAAGLAAIVTPALTGGNVQDLVERETAFSQLSELFAIVCDAVGIARPESNELPRVNVGGGLRELKPSKLPIKTSLAESGLAQWVLAPKFAATLQQLFAQLRSEDAKSINMAPENAKSENVKAKSV